jgi:NAD(P)-dependent dehydrogenase (short-subunit alcohol dehydrogenase family)
MQDLMNLSERVAVVVGGAQGIGLACAQALGGLGAKLVVLDRNTEQGSVAAASLAEAGFEASFAHIDVVSSSQVAAAMATVVAEHGRLDAVVNAAGVACHGDSLELGDEEWDRVISVNLTGAFWVAREAGRQMIAGGRSGSIVTIGSISGEVANVPQRQTAYNASKAGVHNMTRCLAVEWADRAIRVNAIAPGYVETELTRGGLENPEWAARWKDLTPLARVGQPMEIGALAAFLSSDAASYMTGSIVVADGGYLSM